jgi:hypothetical protein
MNVMRKQIVRASILLFITTLSGSLAIAQDDAAAIAMAKKAQNPLGDVRAIMTDNTIAFDGGPEDSTSYGFQFQPVYAIKNESRFNMIFRAILPIVGVEPGVVIPPLGPEPKPPAGSSWGISDTIVQYIFSPKGDSGTKWGIGPQVSLRTRSSARQAGPGWGVGAVGVVFGGAGNWALGAIGMQHWGEENYNVGTLQIIAMYNFESKPGMYLGYNNAMTFNWEATSSNKLTVPLGATFGKTMPVGDGAGLDLSIGAYKLVARPDGAPRWQLKFGISYFFP